MYSSCHACCHSDPSCHLFDQVKLILFYALIKNSGLDYSWISPERLFKHRSMHSHLSEKKINIIKGHVGNEILDCLSVA